MEDRVPDLYASCVVASFQYIYEHVINHMDLPVSSLDIVNAGDKAIIKRWNPTDPYSVEQYSCMHHLVAAKTQEVPTSKAICAWDGSLSYAELSRLSDVAAYDLRLMGVRRGSYVPFAYKKSLWAVVATLAIMKAGGAFVPLNARDPPARLAEICRNVGATIVVTAKSMVKVFQPMVAVVVDISSNTFSLHDCKGSMPDGDIPNYFALTSDQNEEVTPADPIFVLFTSGSTGKPKGMVHTHASICTHAITHGRAMGYYSKRVLQFAAHTFDVAIMDFFTTLLFGGCICIPSEEDRDSNIVGFINANAVDYAILTPSFAGLIEPGEVPTLSTLAIGGEALPQDRIERWADKVHFIQIYGPAEVGICLLTEMKPTTRPDVVGYPLPNSACWLVDPDDPDRLVPIGAVGELVIAGPSLAQGYVGDEGKTRLSFIDAPTWAKNLDFSFARMYKSGDLLRYDIGAMDGSYVFVGRKDGQIKLRGQRIEPGEIEYQIGHLPNVAIAMVTRPASGCFVGELVAVVRLKHVNGQRRHMEHEPIRLTDEQAPTIETLRDYLSKILPSYMIPTACLTIENFPVVPSLKVDRRKVSAWLAGMSSRLRGPLLRTMARLDDHEDMARDLSHKVAEILNNKKTDDMSLLKNHDFSLQQTGIDSIQIISLSMYLHRRYGKKLPTDILLNPSITIRHLAQLLDNAVPALNGRAESMLENCFSLEKSDYDAEAFSLSSGLFLTLPQRQRLKDESRQQPTRNILLTGATGYLGVWILRHLLLDPSLHIYVLLRCPTPSNGLTQLITAAKSQGWWQDAYSPNVSVLNGDLSKPLLGLGDREVESVTGAHCDPTDTIHAIIHSGAIVHYSSGYQSLKAVNVLSTTELLRLVAQAPHLSDFVFISGGFNPSYSVDLSSAVLPEELREAGGYAQTKYVCERVLEQCSAHAAFATKRLQIVKPGYIVGGVSNGLANRKDFIWRLVAGCVEIGAYNRDEAEHWLYVASADLVAEHVVGCIDSSESKQSKDGHIERVLSGLYFSELWDVVQEICGSRLEPLAGEEWMQRLVKRVLEVGETHLLYPLLEVLQRDGGHIGEKGLEGDFSSSEDTRKVVRRNLEHLVKESFLPSCRKEAVK